MTFLVTRSGCGDLVTESVICIYHLGESFRLVSGKGVHRIQDDGLDALLTDVSVAVVKDREQEIFSLARTGSGCDECVLRMMSVLCVKFPEGLYLMSVRREPRLDYQKNLRPVPRLRGTGP